MFRLRVNFLLVFLPAVVAFVQTALATSGDVTLETVTGRQVPLSAVRSRLLKISSEEASKRIFEIRESVIEGPGVRIDIEKETGKSVKLPDLPRTQAGFPESTVTVNGIDISDNVKHAFVKRGKSVRVVHMGDGEIVAVFGKNIALTPLHVDDHPGIFINTAGRSSTASLEGDTIGDGKKNGSNGDDSDVGEGFDSHKKGAGVAAVDTETVGRTGASRKNVGIAGIATQTSVRAAAWNACRKGNVIRLYELAFASDSTLCKAYGNNPSRTRAAIEGMVDGANSPYRLQTCLFLFAKHIELNCNSNNDPYKKIRFLKTTEWLPTFGMFWHKNRKNIKRDSAVFVPGYTDGTSTLGVAYIGKTCTQFGYAWIESLDDHVLAHELGHNLNCPHSQYGLMTAELSYFSVKLFASDSLEVLYDFVDNDAKCLQPFGYKKESCAARFTASNAFICKKSQWGYVYSVTKKSDRVNVVVEQVYDYFLVTLKSSPGVKIYRIATAFVPYSWVFSSDLGPKKLFKNGVTQYSFKVKTSDVEYPYSSGTCCGNEMAVVLDIRFCNGGQCVDGFHGFWDLVSCGSCDKGQKLLPQSATRKCALCKS